MVLGGAGVAGACLASDGRAVPPARCAGLLARNVGARGGARLRAEAGRPAGCYAACASCSV
eukprot:7201294-Lingulodinium_polyedra.AAC.1